MNARTFLVRGLLAGLLAGIATFVVALTVGEPPIDSAIALESSAAVAAPAGHVLTSDAGWAEPTGLVGGRTAHAHGGEHDEGGISRTTQKTWGLATGTIAIGVALGGIVSLVAAAVAGRMGRLSLVGSTALVTAVGFVAYSLVPFLKYPAAPPAVGSGDTIGERTAYYFAFALVSLLAMVAAVALGRRLAGSRGAWAGVVGAGAFYVAVMALTAVVMPAVNELGSFPADVLWQFRVSSLLTLATLWAVLGVALTWLLDRAARQAPAPA